MKEIEELQSEYYIFATMRLFTTEPNLNKVQVTKAFVEDIVENKENYIGLPLFVDMNKLRKNFLKNLDHAYDRKNDEFKTEMVGSFYDFELEEIDKEIYGLIGKVKIAKRNRQTVEAIKKMFAEHNLNVSFEIAVKDSKQADGITIVDKGEGNMLVGMAIVTLPACENATTLKLVANIDENVLRDAIATVIDGDFEILQTSNNTALVIDENRVLSIVRFEVADKRINIKGVDKVEDILKEKGEELTVETLAEATVDETKQEEVVAEEKPMEEQPIEENPEKELEEKTEEESEEKEDSDDDLESLKEQILAIGEQIKDLAEYVNNAIERIVKLEEAQAKYDEVTTKAEAEIEERKNEKLKELVAKLGLDINDAKVAELIEKRDLEGIMNLVGEYREDKNVSLASYADIRLTGEYGGLLDRIGE